MTNDERKRIERLRKNGKKTRKIQEDFFQVLKRDDAMSTNIMLIDKKQIHNNRLQVINQYTIGQDQGAKHRNWLRCSSG